MLGCKSQLLSCNSQLMIIRVLVIVANICILYYVVDMERNNCHCSESWLRDYIKVVSSIIITFVVVSLVIPSFPEMVTNSVKKNRVLIVPILLWNVVAIVYLGVLLTYYYRLRQHKCECSEDWKRNMLLYPAVLLVPLLIWLFTTFGRRLVKGISKK